MNALCLRIVAVACAIACATVAEAQQSLPREFAMALRPWVKAPDLADAPD